MEQVAALGTKTSDVPVSKNRLRVHVQIMVVFGRNFDNFFDDFLDLHNLLLDLLLLRTSSKWLSASSVCKLLLKGLDLGLGLIKGNNVGIF